MGRFRWVLAVVVLVLAFGTPADGAADARTADRRAPGVILKASVPQAEEGDRVTLSARIKSPATARRVTLLRLNVPTYGSPSWDPVKSVRARDRAKVSFAIVAAGPNTDRYRVSVTYAGKRAAVASKPISVTVWRWIPLRDYGPYYSAGHPDFGQVSLNGRRYDGWGARYVHVGSWEARFTPGRHCKAFRGVLGLSDTSDDGSSGTIGFTADDGPVYSSPPLTPGTELPVEVALATPYRFGIQLADTSPDKVESWPVIGDPAFLCTGV